jgi:dihydrodipicolinate reductase
MDMKILVVGAGKTGAAVILQLQKNPELEVITCDPRTEPFAVREGIVESIDYHEALTPLTLEFVLQKAAPDLVLITTTSEDMGLGSAPGLDVLADALHEEIASLSDAPVIQATRLAGG